MTNGRIIVGRVATAVAVLVALAGAFCVYTGYWGGDAVTVVPAAQPQRRTAAVWLSGDLGFRLGLGPQIARRLAADGVPAVGVNSLVFFRHERTPAEVTAMLADAERRALALAHGGKVMLIGQSFGADMLHVGLAGLSPALRAHVARVALIVPETTVEYRASPSEAFSWNVAEVDAMPTARTLGREPTLCIHGAEETVSLCPHLHQPGVTDVALPGGHPMHRDTDAVYRTLRRFLFA